MPPRHNRRKRDARNDPVYDQGCPPPPYIKGSRWVIQRHEPPPPFGHGYKTKYRRDPQTLLELRDLKTLPSIYCMQNPPTGPEPPLDAPKLQIEVTEVVRVQASQGPQLFVCRFVSDEDGAAETAGEDDGPQMVAKLYDPMYYHARGKSDILESSDMEYSREAAAYKYLQDEGIDGQLLPMYYGSFTTDVPLTAQQKVMMGGLEGGDGVVPDTRKVRLILMERVDGEAMRYQLVFGDLAQIPTETRLTAIASSMEAYARLYFHGIVHADLAPRNIFLAPRTHDSNGVMATRGSMMFHRFIDLDVAFILGGQDSTHERQPPNERRPTSPIRIFWDVFASGVTNMYQWFPHEMRNTHTIHSWLLRRWYGDTRFEPIGAMPEPSGDGTPWGTTKTTPNVPWTGEKYMPGEFREDDVLTPVMAKRLDLMLSGKADWEIDEMDEAEAAAVKAAEAAVTNMEAEAVATQAEAAKAPGRKHMESKGYW